MKVFLLALDDFGYGFLVRWTGERGLSNFSRLFEKGMWGVVLNAEEMPSAAKSWASVFTGVRPGRHGVERFHSPTKVERRALGFNPPEILNPDHPFLWSIVGRNGKRAICRHLTFLGPTMDYNREMEREHRFPPGSERIGRNREELWKILEETRGEAERKKADLAVLQFQQGEPLTHKRAGAKNGGGGDHPIGEWMRFYDNVVGRLLELENYRLVVVSIPERPEEPAGRGDGRGVFLCEDVLNDRQDLGIRDVSPLILWMLGISIPAYMRKEKVAEIYRRIRAGERGFL
ncbi:hypothetical protein AKJ39_01530 [candidate division MSBL1 archaeon SCGC-AAA259J03]|uniref:Sulfatase N-terminal domain-containing protein n=1 Tax=candidate division MSBL1 archaeon SCGC-AAA259J03 TaxID=1698269 RepID=A0A656YXE0_9EURY|nr:hypothetical protein AKJ39_01530 [candidate division MSBL1 archaeon SCGC-AAA259J03]